MKKILFLILSAFLLDIMPTAAKEQYVFTRISQKEGLTSTVDCICKEQDGYVWICSGKGLYRFNGHDLFHYNDSLFDQRAVSQVEIDLKGNIWVLTERGLLCNAKGGEDFRQIRIDGKDADYPFYSMCSDQDYAWFGSLGKVFRYSYADETLSCFSELSGEASFSCRFIEFLDEDTILCCSHNGITLIDKFTGRESKPPFSSRSAVSAVLTDSRGLIWLGLYNKGVEVYDKSGRRIKKYDKSNSPLSNDIVLCMTERDSKIWAGTDGGGINIIDPLTDGIEVMSHISGDPSSLPAHSIKSIYTDQYGNIWAGSVRDGLICISYSKMYTYTDVHIGLRHGMSNSTVLTIFQEPGSEVIWVGTDGGGVNCFDPASNLFTHYEATLGMKVVSIASYSQSELLISSYADDFWLFNKTSGQVRPFKVDDKDLNYQMRYSGRRISLLNENADNILIHYNRLMRLDIKTGKTSYIPFSDGQYRNIFYAGRSEKGHWFYNRNCIYLLREGESVLEKVGENNRHDIFSADIDGNGIIWLGTDCGLCRFSTDSLSFTHLESSIIRKAANVVCDDKGRVWVGADSHLYAYISETNNFALFGESDGVVIDEYMSTPHLLSSSSDVYLGGVQGLLKIDADFEINASQVPNLLLYEVTVDNTRVKPREDEVYKIPRNSHSMDIAVSVYEKDMFRNKMYKFVLDGRTKYEFISEKPTLHLDELPSSGKYQVYVSCTKRDGGWMDLEKIADLKIPQPWYRTGWFYAIVLVLLAVAMLTAFSYYYQRRENRRRLAQKDQEQKIYEEKVRMLINISHELRTPLTLIMAPLKRLLKDMPPEDEGLPVLNRIYRQSVRMRDLLNMVLDLRKMEVGKNTLKLDVVPMNEWVQGAVRDIQEEERAAGIEIVADFDDSVGEVEMDTRKCDTILTNILINAVKHSASGDRITIRTRLNGDRVRISVSDQGPGLRDIDSSRMFTRFYQSNSEQYGSGIGLAYSKILVELHGGSIGAENNPDVGAVFWWELPLKQDEDAHKTTPARAYLNELMGVSPDIDQSIPEKDDFNMSAMTLMLVDDNTDLLDFLRESLGGEFKEIITLTGGNKVLEYLQTGRLPDMIISDVNMPDGDGYTLCGKLKDDERFCHIPVVLLTARGEEKSQSDSYRMGADAFLAKPFEIETLLELTRNLLRSKSEIKRKYFGDKMQTGREYGSSDEQFILRFNKIVAEHLSDPDLDQQLICRELGVSRALLYNKMKSITGVGAKEYITKIRIERAKKLIETTELSILEISEMTGFSGQAYFSTAFKNYTGMTPSQYKQENIKGK